MQADNLMHIVKKIELPTDLNHENMYTDLSIQ